MLKRLSIACLTTAAVLTLASCVSEQIDDPGTRAAYLQLSLNMPLSNADAPTGYENGNIYENGISNYQILFYTADTDEYICTLNSQTISATDTDQHTEYTITGKITDDEGNNPLESTDGSTDVNFKVVMIANWDYTVTPVAGSTIADLCNNTEGQYSALSTDQLDLSQYKRYLPYFGVHTYSGINLERNGTTKLPGALTLLRAVAKVEIIIANDSDGDDNITLASATLHHYNKTGFCAPKNVTSEDDYGQAKDWASDYTDGNMHLVNEGMNDDKATSQDLELIKIQDRERDSNGKITQKEKWIAYMPEYDNSGDDFAYIALKFNHALDEDDSKIYFAVYDSDGKTHAYDAGAAEEEVAKRRSILRNNLYRYNVTVTQGKLYVVPDEWEYVFDNEWTFGTMDGTGEVLGNQSRIQVNDIEYEVTNSENREVMVTYVTSTEGEVTTYIGTIDIPETIRYDGVDYTVTAIGEESFYMGEKISSVSIPKTVTSIGKLAFYDCKGMESITCYNPTPPGCDADVFNEADVGKCILYVPTESVSTYQSTSPWSSFTSIEAIED